VFLAPIAAGTGSTTREGEIGVKIESRVFVCRSDRRNWFPKIHRMANGNLLATCHTAADETNPGAGESGRPFDAWASLSSMNG
jgi:hypothetical protein